MLARFVSEMTEGSRVDATFVLRAKEVRAARTGDAYLRLELGDRTGTLPAVLFRPAPAAIDVPVGSVVRAQGTLTVFRGARRLSLDSMRAAERWEPGDFVAASARARDEVVEEFRTLVRSVADVVLGDRMITAAAARARLSGERLARLQHAVLSHHGELEWGSPKRPSTLEALLLHHVDNLDAKATGFTELLAGATAAQEAWTDASNMFRRPLYAPRAAEDDRPVGLDEDAAQFPRTA